MQGFGIIINNYTNISHFKIIKWQVRVCLPQQNMVLQVLKEAKHQSVFGVYTKRDKIKTKWEDVSKKRREEFLNEVHKKDDGEQKIFFVNVGERREVRIFLYLHICYKLDQKHIT